MADKQEKRSVLPWGMTKEGLQPNSVKTITQAKLKAFRLGSMNAQLSKTAPFVKKKEQREEKKRIEEKEAAQVFEDFVASFEGTDKAGKTFVRGSTITPGSTGDGTKTSASGAIYKPTSKILQKIEEKSTKEEEKSLLSSSVGISSKPLRKKGTDKKKSILELFRDELKRKQEDRKDRQSQKSTGLLPLSIPKDEVEPPQMEDFKVDEYKDMLKGSFDTGDPLTTNLYVGNINPKMNEENLCQLFGKFGPLASVKVMWPRTEEERARNRNCGFVAFMKREDGEKALEHFKGTTIMDYEVQVGWGKAVPIPPHPIYVPPDLQEEEKSKVPDPPSGLPFNAQVLKKSNLTNSAGQYGTVPPPAEAKEDPDHVPSAQQDFQENLYNSVVRVVVPTDTELLCLIHRMIEFVIREGPMFEAMIMNKEFHNPKFQFLFENQSPAHVYYRWKLFSILQGDSPETWRTEDFRMFEGGSLWKPPPLKNLRSKVLPPIEREIVKKGQLSSKRRDELEDQLRNISMEREKIKTTMVWCMDRAESSEEIVECITESLCIRETPLPMKIARLYLVSDILHNCGASVPNVSNFRRGFEGKMTAILEHFHDVMKSITSRIRTEQFKRRVLGCLRSWDQMSVYHFNLVDKLREVFIGKTHEELEKQKAFETVAALMTVEETSSDPIGVDGVPLLDDQPIDFSKIASSIDGVPMEDNDNLDGEPLPSDLLDGAPIADDDIDGLPMDTDTIQPSRVTAVEKTVKSKWELVDYGDDSDDTEGSPGQQSNQKEQSIISKQKQQIMAEVDERKRRMLRDVELKVVELTDALESSGSYTKAEISEKVAKFRDKLMQEAVEPKLSPSRKSSSIKERSRSPSPSTIAKYSLEDSSRLAKSHSPDLKRKQSQPKSPSRKHSTEGHGSSSHSHDHSRRRARSRSPTKRRSRSRSRSPLRKQSPARKRSRSRSSSPHRSTHSSRHKSPKSRRHRSRSRSRSPKKSKKRSRSRSPHKTKSSSKKKR